MTNACISSQEASSFVLLGSRMEHFLSFPVRAALVMAVIYSIWSQGSLTWSVGGERAGLVRLLLPPPPSRIRSNHNNLPKPRLPVQFLRVILDDPVHTRASHPHVQAPRPQTRHCWQHCENLTARAEMSFLFWVFHFQFHPLCCSIEIRMIRR